MTSPALDLKNPARYPPTFEMPKKDNSWRNVRVWHSRGTPMHGQCIPQITKLREELKSCAKCCAASKNPATTLAKLVDETTSKSARFRAAQTVLSSPPAVPSNLSQRSGASRNEERYQAPTPQHNVDKFSRRPDRQKRSYSSCPKLIRQAAVRNLAAPSRQPCYHLCWDGSAAG